MPKVVWLLNRGITSGWLAPELHALHCARLCLEASFKKAITIFSNTYSVFRGVTKVRDCFKIPQEGRAKRRKEQV